MVIKDGKIANPPPYPPTPWNANPRDIYGTAGPHEDAAQNTPIFGENGPATFKRMRHMRSGPAGPSEDAVQNTPIFEENGPDKFKGIDIMRAVRSFDPCLPCGVHMYLGNGKVLETRPSPMFGLQAE